MTFGFARKFISRLESFLPIDPRRLDMESSESETGSVQAESDSSDTEAPICASQDLQDTKGN